MIEVKNLRKVYRNIVALDGISFRVERGEIFAFLGPNGAGKTTTMNILMGFIFPTSGEAKIFGRDVLRDGKNIRKKIGFLPEELGFYDTLTAYENMDFYARLFGIPKAEREERILNLLEMVGLLERKDSKVREYSHGMKQRLGIAQSLINEPELLIYDEPTSGLDPRASYEIRNLIKELVKEGITLFLSSHLLHEVQQICNTVAIINKGKLIRKDKIKNLIDEIKGKGIQVKITCLNINEDIIESVKKVNGLEDLKVFKNILVARVKDEKTTAEINSAIVKAGGKITKMEEKTPNLEEIFLKLTEEK
ncbi:MAG TPA: ABC transporter ATP-binding protein [Thermoplasmatales archaeon]|nr:ABC transporter ATP-binding protein [Thermoplasmatales archaeon]